MQTQGQSLLSSLALAFFITQYAVAGDINQQFTPFNLSDQARISMDFGQIASFSKPKSMTGKNVQKKELVNSVSAIYWCAKQVFKGNFSECFFWPPGSRPFKPY